MMHKIFAASCLAGVVITGAAAPAYAGGGNPNGTGPPSQSCQDSEARGGTTPGNSSSSPGSPFNEPGIQHQRRYRRTALQREVAVRRRLHQRTPTASECDGCECYGTVNAEFDDSRHQHLKHRQEATHITRRVNHFAANNAGGTERRKRAGIGT